MAVEHLQRHLPEIDKSIATQKTAKTLFPSMGTVRMKIKDFMKQNALEKESSKEPETVKLEATKSKPAETEKIAEKAPENKKTASAKKDENIENKKGSEENGKEDKVSETNNKHSKIKIPNITIDYNHTLINTKTQIYEDSYR